MTNATASPSSDIIAALEKAVNHADPSGFVPRSALSEILRLLSESGQYSQFDGKLHTIGSGVINFTLDGLAASLGRRALRVGAESALAELHAYIEAEELHLLRLLLLHDIHIDNEFTFSNGVQLLEVGSLPDSRLRDLLYRRQFDRFIGGHVGTVLAVDYTHRKIVNAGEAPPRTAFDEEFKKTRMLDDTRYLLSLARHSEDGVPVVAATTLVPANLGFLELGSSYNPFPEPHTAFGPPIIPLEAAIADGLLNSFNAMDDTTKDRLRIALKRLNDTKIDPVWPNKSINLRICLENIFLNPHEGDQIRRRLSDRMPSLTEFSKTRAGKAYRLLSRAVHTGQTQHHPEFDERTIAGQVQIALRAIIAGGAYPVWPAD